MQKLKPNSPGASWIPWEFCDESKSPC